MKVLHVSHGYLPECSGGVEFYLRELVAAQKAAGLDVVLVSGCLDVQSSCGLEEVDVDGLRVLRLWRDDWYHDHYARAWHPEIGPLFASLLRQERPDIVHLHHWLRLSNDLVQISEASGTPTVVTLHDVYTSCPRVFRMHRDGSPCFRKLTVSDCRGCVPRFGHEAEDEVDASVQMFKDCYRDELLAARRVFVAMQSTADLIARTADLPASLFHVTGLGYRRRLSDQRLPAPAPVPSRIGHWGSLLPHKGVIVLLLALRELRSQAPELEVELHLFGPIPDPHFATVVAEHARDLPVVLHGPYDLRQVRDARLQVGVFPSVCIETYGLVLAECFEMGLPAIVSDIGALPERAGEAALRVVTGDIHDLARALRRVLSEPALLEDLRAALPSLPPTPAEHATLLQAHYEAAIASPASVLTDLNAQRRQELRDWQQATMTAAIVDPTRPPSPK